MLTSDLFPTTSDDLVELLRSENQYRPFPDYIRRLRDGSVDVSARQNAVSWILKVRLFYGFRPVTAYLAVNYLDRFLSNNYLPEGRWPWQLLSVACLSVAAKMEETQVPALLDLQVMHPDFVFDPTTVTRMELLMMDALEWRMRSVTPFDFLQHFASNCGVSSSAVVSCATDLVLHTQLAVDFMEYRPSAISAAAILCSRELVANLSLKDNINFTFVHDVLHQATVDSCRRLMDTCRRSVFRWTKNDIVEDVPLTPQSPVGVLDAADCGSCDSSGRSSLSAVETISSDQQTSPASKRRRIEIISSFHCTETLDTIDL